MGLIESLPEGPVAIDTAIVIYLAEGNERYLDCIRPLFEAADRGERTLVTSGVTLLEVLVVPYRWGDLALASRYEALLTRSRGLTLVDLDLCPCFVPRRSCGRSTPSGRPMRSSLRPGWRGAAGPSSPTTDAFRICQLFPSYSFATSSDALVAQHDLTLCARDRHFDHLPQLVRV